MDADRVLAVLDALEREGGIASSTNHARRDRLAPGLAWLTGEGGRDEERLRALGYVE